jgi:hypothetical protein
MSLRPHARKALDEWAVGLIGFIAALVAFGAGLHTFGGLGLVFVGWQLRTGAIYARRVGR